MELNHPLSALPGNAMNVILNIVLLSLVASLGTGLGGLLAGLQKPGRRLFGFLMGLTGGVMISLSFLGLVNRAWELKGFLTATLGFGAGALFMLAIDMLIPHIRFNELEASKREHQQAYQVPDAPSQGFSRHRFFRRHRRRFRETITDPRLYKTGMLLAFGITIHNLPEGIAVGAGYMDAPRFGLLIALAIMLHNIPEGIATALPLCRSGMNKWKAFRVALFSGFAEPVGALLAALFLNSFQALVPASLAFAGGVMMFITLDELIPAAREHGHQHTTAVGIIIGSLFVFILSGLLGI
jgi:ZIP family zinc transporter